MTKYINCVSQPLKLTSQPVNNLYRAMLEYKIKVVSGFLNGQTIPNDLVKSRNRLFDELDMCGLILV
jgi:hypothetical protein